MILSARRLPGALLLAGILYLAACSDPPRGPATDPGAATPSADPGGATEETQAEEATDDDSDGYDLRQEGPFPPPADVKFEEDILDPPEEAEGEPFDERRVEEETLPEEGSSKPLPPTVDTPIEASVEAQQPPTDPNAPLDYRVERGFRVQLLASGSHVEATKNATEAQTRLRVPVYVTPEGALYKVRAGDFTDRAEAQALRARAQGNGYPEAWVVSTEIRVFVE